MKGENLSRKILLLDSSLLEIILISEKDTALLVIPETCADKIITLYHSSLVAGYQGEIKTYFTVGDKFSIPSLIHHSRMSHMLRVKIWKNSSNAITAEN